MPPDDVGINSTASYTVAADEIGTRKFQFVKLVDGIAEGTGVVAATTGIPAVGTTGLVVAVIPGVSVSAQVSGSVTILGTALASIVPGVSITIQQGASVSAVVSGTITASGAVFTTADQAAVSTALAVRGTVTIIGTAIVSVVPGVSVTIQQGASVTIQQGASITGSVNIVSVALVSVSDVVAITTAASVSVTGLPIWLNPTQQVVVSGLAGHSVSMAAGTIATVLTIVTILGTQLISNVGTVNSTVGTVIAVSGITAVSVVSSIVTILGTQIVTVAGMLFTTGSPAQSSTGQIMAYKDNANIPVMIQISSTVVGSSTTMLMTIYTGATFVTTGASFWVIPAGKTFRIMAMQVIAVSSVVLSRAQFCVLVGTAAVSVSVVATVGIPACLCYAIQASTTPFTIQGLAADVAAGTTVGIGVKGGTSHSVQLAAVHGYLF